MTINTTDILSTGRCRIHHTGALFPWRLTLPTGNVLDYQTQTDAMHALDHLIHLYGRVPRP